MENENSTGHEEISVEGRSLFDLSTEELEQIIATEQFPEGVNLTGIDEQDGFEKLFRYRSNPKMLAKILIKKRLGQRVLAEPISVKEKRLAIREIEAKTRASKQESAMFYQKQILEELKSLKLKVDILLRHIINSK